MFVSMINPSMGRFILGFALLVTLCSTVCGQDVAEHEIPVTELVDRDYAQWKELLSQGDFRKLDEIGDRLRTQHVKYRNGRGRYWRYCWLAVGRTSGVWNDDDFAKLFDVLEAWRLANPKSVNVRIVAAQTWMQYAYRIRDGIQTSETKYTKIGGYEKRLAKAEAELNAIPDRDVDNVQRRLRMILDKDRGIKPDVDLVYAGLEQDPAGMELVHQMAYLLMPRWFGKAGEVEEFADEVVRRTKDQCGELHYVTVAVSLKDLLHTYLIPTHDLKWDRLKQGFDDLERLYPESREHLDDKAQLAFMGDDLETVYRTIEQIGDQPTQDSWKQVEVNFNRFRSRITAEMLAGNQRRLLMSRTGTTLLVHAMQDGDLTFSVDWDTTVWSHNTATGQRLGWAFLGGIRSETASIDPDTGFLLTGLDEPGVYLYHLLDGRSGRLPIPEEKVRRTAISGAGGMAAAATDSGRVTVIGLKTGEVVHTFAPPTPREIHAMEFSPQGNQLAVVTQAGELHILNIKEKSETVTRKISSDPLRSVDWAGQRIAVGTDQGEVHVYPDAAAILDAKAITWKPNIPNLAASLDFSPDQKKLAIGLSNDNRDIRMEETLYVWEFGSDKPATQLIGHKMGVNSVRFIDQGRSLLSGSSDWSVRVWDAP